MPVTLQEFLQIGIVGIFLSFAVEMIKARFGTSSNATKGITLGLAVVLGAAYYFLVGTPLWVNIVGVLSAATVFYAFFIRE